MDYESLTALRRNSKCARHGDALGETGLSVLPAWLAERQAAKKPAGGALGKKYSACAQGLDMLDRGGCLGCVRAASDV